jgi:hypothetical protein
MSGDAPESAPSGAPPSPEAVAAASKVTPNPDPPPAPEPEPEIEELPADQDQFPREYVQKLRDEAAKHRTRARDIESAFEGYSPEEKGRFLELAQQLISDPAAALEEFEAVTNNLREITGKAPTMPEPTTPPAGDPPAPAPAPEAAPAAPAAEALTMDDVEKLVADRLEAERTKATKDAEVEATLKQAESLGFESPAQKAQLFAKAQEKQVSLEEAAGMLTGDFEAAVEAAVAKRMEGVRTGANHPPRTPAGDPANAADQGPPKTLEEARKRAEARMDAAGFSN